MRPLSRTRLFLLELLVNLLVFCVGAAICLMTLTRAYSLSADSRALTEAQRITENAAIAFRATEADLFGLPQLLSGRVEGDTLTVWYGKDWQTVREKYGIYRLTVRADNTAPMIRRAIIKVYPPEGKPLTSLTISVYTGMQTLGGQT